MPARGNLPPALRQLWGKTPTVTAMYATTVGENTHSSEGFCYRGASGLLLLPRGSGVSPTGTALAAWQFERSEVGTSRPARSRVFSERSGENTESDLRAARGRRGRSPLHQAFRGLSCATAGRTTKEARSSCLDRASEKRQRPTLPPGGAVPSALVRLTSLFGMGRGGSTPL